MLHIQRPSSTYAHLTSILYSIMGLLLSVSLSCQLTSSSYELNAVTSGFPGGLLGTSVIFNMSSNATLLYLIKVCRGHLTFSEKAV